MNDYCGVKLYSTHSERRHYTEVRYQLHVPDALPSVPNIWGFGTGLKPVRTPWRRDMSLTQLYYFIFPQLWSCEKLFLMVYEYKASKFVVE
jgi:hypothetical protein